MFFKRKDPAASTVVVPKGYHAEVPWVPHIGDIFPNFTARSTHGEIVFHDWAEGHWVLFFSHTSAFTSVCTTEIASLANAQRDFAERGVRILGLSRSPIQEQMRWLDEITGMFGTKVRFPMIADGTGRLSDTFGMLHPKEIGDLAIRKSFVIDPALKLRMVFEYPVFIGRSTEEMLRVIDALQMQDGYEVATPADWQAGENCLLPPGVTDAAATEKYGTRWKKLAEYLKTVDIDKALD